MLPKPKLKLKRRPIGVPLKPKPKLIGVLLKLIGVLPKPSFVSPDLNKP